MCHISRPPMRRGLGSLIMATAMLLTLAGCQTYERSDLDLEAYRLSVEARLSDSGPVTAFGEQRQIDTGDFDLRDGVTAEEAEALALFYNPDLRLARLEAGVALANKRHAGAWRDPVLGFTGEDVLGSGAPFEYGVTLGVTLPISGRLSVERDRAGAAHRVELRRVEDLEWNTRHAVRVAWAGWSAARERVELLRSSIEDLGEASGIADRLEQAGELARSESRLLRIELAQRRSALGQARVDAQGRHLTLLGLMGLAPGSQIELHPSLTAPPPPGPSDSIGWLTQANTALAVERAAYRLAEESLRLEVRKQYPDIELGGGYGSEDDDRLLLGVSLPIGIFNANRGGIARARAERELARARAQTTLERLAEACHAARARYEALRDQEAIYEQEIVPMLEAQTREIRELMSLGEVSTLLLLETVTRSYGARSRLLELRLARQEASIELSRLLGPEPHVDSDDIVELEPQRDASDSGLNTNNTIAGERGWSETKGGRR